VAPPRTWADLLGAVDTFRDRGIAPIALAGDDRWPALLYLAYLADRIGGPGVLAAITAGKPGAWHQEPVLRAARMVQDLARRGAFGPDAGSASGYDTTTTTSMLATGQAAMQLMGSWEYADQLRHAPAFAAADLGWVPFPAVPGGAGDPSDLVGVPANYLSVRADSPDRAAAADFAGRALTSPAFVQGLLDAGEVPSLAGLDREVARSPHATFAVGVYRLVTGARNFTLAWDQALPPPLTDVLLDQVDRLVERRTTPEKAVAALDAVPR
jgi:xylobiose transport system substrate-binding protein